jgi:hypothetical protein
VTDVSEAERAASAIAEDLRDRSFGSTRVHDASYEISRDSEGELATFIALTLNDPVGSTWPHGEIVRLRRRIRELMLEHEVHGSLYLRLAPQTDFPQADDEQRLAL